MAGFLPAQCRAPGHRTMGMASRGCSCRGPGEGEPVGEGLLSLPGGQPGSLPPGLDEEQFHFLIFLENTLESTWQAAEAPLQDVPSTSSESNWARRPHPAGCVGGIPWGDSWVPGSQSDGAALSSAGLGVGMQSWWPGSFPRWARALRQDVLGQRRWFLLPGGTQCSWGALSPTSGHLGWAGGSD